MGSFSRLPDSGGVNDQPCWLLDAFDIVSVIMDQPF